ncbi:MAG: ABC transporter [Treponema sp.]|nr:MAG: ABC transporter [Treponema sp.]
MTNVNEFVKKVGLPRIIITAFFILLWVLAITNKLPINSLVSDSIVRIGMNMLLVLAMVPSIRCGTGLNFGIPIGIIAGLFGTLYTVELQVAGFYGLMVALVIAVPLAIAFGILYGLLLNKIKGSEMLVSTYVGFSIVSLFSIIWIVYPFASNAMRWPMGRGLRNVVSVESSIGQVLNDFAAFNIGGVTIPTGLILFVVFICLLYYGFSRTKFGYAMRTVGENPLFAKSSGLNVDKYRILGTVLSTVFAAIGIIVYSQSFGYAQLYQAPLMMAFPAVAAVLIGGADARKANISHAILGTILFQGMLTIALPVAQSFITEGNLSEVIRMIVQNGIILYALTQGKESK